MVVVVFLFCVVFFVCLDFFFSWSKTPKILLSQPNRLVQSLKQEISRYSWENCRRREYTLLNRELHLLSTPAWMIIQIRNIEKKLFILCDCREGGLIFSKYETILEVNGKRKENPKIINLAQNKYESITLHTSSGRVCSNSVLFSFSFQTYIVLPLIRVSRQNVSIFFPFDVLYC